MAQFYFQRRPRGGISFLDLCCYQAGLVAIVSLLYYSIGLPGRWPLYSSWITGFFAGVFSILTLIAIHKEFTKESKVNTFRLLGVLVGIVLSIISFTTGLGAIFS